VANVPRVHGRQGFFTDTLDRKQVAGTREFPRVTLSMLHMYVRLSAFGFPTEKHPCQGYYPWRESSYGLTL